MQEQLRDAFGRDVTYLRVSVTDRCDLRCVYCMAEDAHFLPKKDLLSLEELSRLCGSFIQMGVKKLRLTGGEPLVRRDIMTLFRDLSAHLESGALHELTLTTNGSLLGRYAADLAACGVKRINVSLDTLDADKFRGITRWGNLAKVLDGIDAAQRAGLAVKINTVAMRDVNADEIPNLMRWAHGRGIDMTLIEVMPVGAEDSAPRDQFLSLAAMQAWLAEQFTLLPSTHRTGGPARYMQVAETGGRIGFISPMSHNFCESCNRVRITCTGMLYLCLGQDDTCDLRAALRGSESDEPVRQEIWNAIQRKPRGHDFVVDRAGRSAVRDAALQHRMNTLGG